MMIRPAALVLTLCLLAGCAGNRTPAPPSGVLKVLDPAGAVVATGRLALPDPLPPVGESFEGRWTLGSSTAAFPTQSTVSGRYYGHVGATGVSCDLSGAADSAVVLFGTLSNGVFSGKWTHDTFVGGKEMGTFTVTPPPGGGG